MNDPSIEQRKSVNAVRLAFLDRLRRDGRLTPLARLVGWEIISCVNSVSGKAWPSQGTIAFRLSIDKRSVIRAIRELACFDYILVQRVGRFNEYVPKIGDKLSPKRSANDLGRMTGMQSDGDRKVPGSGDRNVTLSPSRNSLRSPSTASRGKHFRRQRGDELLERDLSEALGSDGSEILSWLFSIDGGQPYFRLIEMARGGALSEHDLHGARLAYQQRVPAGGAGLKGAAGRPSAEDRNSIRICT